MANIVNLKEYLRRVFKDLNEYARAYGFEFSRAYTDILARILKSKKEVSSVSFGCGTGIDYWGMSHAARVILRNDKASLSYTGTDPANWAYKISDYQDMEIINDTEENKKYYFRYEQNHFYTGKKCADGEKLELWQMGNDDFGSFDKLFDGEDNSPAITDVQTWIDVVGRNMCTRTETAEMLWGLTHLPSNRWLPI